MKGYSFKKVIIFIWEIGKDDEKEKRIERWRRSERERERKNKNCVTVRRRTRARLVRTQFWSLTWVEGT